MRVGGVLDVAIQSLVRRPAEICLEQIRDPAPFVRSGGVESVASRTALRLPQADHVKRGIHHCHRGRHRPKLIPML